MNEFRNLWIWCATHRNAIAILLLFCAGGAVKYRGGLELAHREGLREVQVTATYVGALQRNVSNRRQGANTTVDAGYGIAIPNDIPRDPFIRSIIPNRYILFAPAFNISERDVEMILRDGNIYTLHLWNEEIVAIAGMHGPIISFDDYLARASTKRDVWMLVGIALGIFGVSFWGLAGNVAKRAQ